MAKAPQKIVLSGSRDIPFDRLILSQSNVRRVKAGVSIGELGGYRPPHAPSEPQRPAHP